MNFVPNSLRLGNAKHVWRFSRLAEFIIFSKYRDVAEKSIREYLEYFATRNPSSPETKKIDRMVKWYQTDNETRKRYMTWQQEIDIAVDRERQRANDAEMRFYEAKDRANKAEARADEAEARANEAKGRADEAEARADKYEKMLRELGKL